MRFAGGWCSALWLGLAMTPVFAADKAADDASPKVMAMADELVALALEYDPTPAYYEVLPLERHDYLPRNSADDNARLDAREDALWARLQAIDPQRLADRQARDHQRPAGRSRL